MVLLNRNNNRTYFSHNVTSYKNFLKPNVTIAELEFGDLITRDSLYVVIPLTVLYSFILLAGVLGNLINCLVIIKIKYMHTTTNFYLFSLSVSDLLLLTSGLPQEIYFIWYRYPYIFGETFCVLRGLMAEMSANATVLTIIAFTVERYVAICHPFYSQSVTDLSRAIKLIIIIWILGLIFATPLALQFDVVQIEGPETAQCTLPKIMIPYSFELSTLFFFIIPMIVITILYAMIGIKLKNSAKVKQRLVCRSLFNYSSSSANTSRSSMYNHRPSQKVLKSLVAVVVTFFICWAPFHAQRLVAIYGMTPDNPGSSLMRKIYDSVTYVSAILYYTSAMMNPVLYQITCHKFREAFKKTISSLF